MKKVIIVLVVILSLSGKDAFSQVSVNFYPFQSVLSVSTNTENLVWGDFRMGTNTSFSNINLELDGMVNFKKTDWVNYYAGLGVNLNPTFGVEDLSLINGYLLNAGIRVMPFQNHKNVQGIFEISPFFNKDFDGGMVRTLIGLGYNF